MPKDAYVVVWNESKTEGVIFRNNMGDSGEDDARHAADVRAINPCSSLADAFREIYGEDGDNQCFTQEVNIDASKAVNSEDF